jgi:diguanylate cyclase (GGDEF)-like protein
VAELQSKTFAPTLKLAFESAEAAALDAFATRLADERDDAQLDEVVAQIGALLHSDRSALSEETAAKIADYFVRVSTLTLEPLDVVPHREAWRELTRKDVEPGWIMRPFAYVNERLSAQAKILFGHDLPQYEAVQRALGKLAFFQLSSIFELMHDARRQMHGTFALHHALTKLPNRILFLDLLHDRLAQNAKTSGKLATLLIDIEFSSIVLNSVTAMTHDDLMLECADRLRSILREEDVLGQSGRNQFCLILPNLKMEGQAQLAASKFARLLEIPIAKQGVEVPARISVGIAISPNHGRDPELLLQRAELAKREARQRGEQVLLYEDMFGEEELNQRLLEEQFRIALHENEFAVYFQPQLDLRSGQVQSVEALLRWRTRTGEFVPPNVVVGIAERTGQIGRLSNWMTNTALRHCADLQRAGYDINVGVNLTAMNLAERELPDFVDQALRTWGLSPQHLTIEITEGSMLNDAEQTIQILQRLNDIGVELSIDDFGTGYSSLSYLKRLPVDELKIDQMFVRNMLKIKRDEQIVRTVIDLAHNFDLTVIAEGVEDHDTLAALKDLGCDKIQGYVLARPMPASDLLPWLEKNCE